MRLDPNTAAIGTKGYMPMDLADFYAAEPEIESFQEPTVFLGEDRQWRIIRSTLDSLEDGDPIDQKTPVYSDWQSALRHVIDSERQALEAEVEEANRFLECLKKLEQLLSDSQ